MAEHRWSLMCRRGVVDKYTNLLSLLEVVDQVGLEPLQDPLPEGELGIPISLQLVSMWWRSNMDQPEVVWTTVSVSGPNGEEYAPDKVLEGNLETHSRTRLIFGFDAIPYYGSGIYHFNVKAGESPEGPMEVIDRVPLEIKMGTASPAST